MLERNEVCCKTEETVQGYLAEAYNKLSEAICVANNTSTFINSRKDGNKCPSNDSEVHCMLDQAKVLDDMASQLVAICKENLQALGG